MFCTFSAEQNRRFNDLLISVNSIKNQNTELETISNKYDEFLCRINSLEKERKENKKNIHLLEFLKLENGESRT